MELKMTICKKTHSKFHVKSELAGQGMFRVVVVRTLVPSSSDGRRLASISALSSINRY